MSKLLWRALGLYSHMTSAKDSPNVTMFYYRVLFAKKCSPSTFLGFITWQVRVTWSGDYHEHSGRCKHTAFRCRSCQNAQYICLLEPNVYPLDLQKAFKVSGEWEGKHVLCFFLIKWRWKGRSESFVFSVLLLGFEARKINYLLMTVMKRLQCVIWSGCIIFVESLNSMGVGSVRQSPPYYISNTSVTLNMIKVIQTGVEK